MRSTTQLLLLCSALWSHISVLATTDSQQRPLVDPAATLPNTDHADDAPPYRKQLLDLHKALVEIPSISGSEGDVAAYLDRLLRSHGYTVELQCLPDSSPSFSSFSSSNPRCNVLAWLPQPDDPPSKLILANRVLITSHIDVVPPYIPYRLNNILLPPSTPINHSLITPDTRISGRGTVDAKASVAAQLTALHTLLTTSSIPPSSIALLFVVGEETSGIGMKHFSSSPVNPPNHDPPAKLKSAIFGEPTENNLACGHKGIATGTLRARGQAGHSGYPWLGKSATGVLIHALAKLLDTDLGSSERYGNTTVNVGTMEGGVAANVIAKEASAKLAVRIAVGEEGTGRGIVEKRMREVIEEVDAGALELEVAAGYGPVECACDVEGFNTMVANYGTDVPNLKGDHISYLYGPGSILVAHGDDESLRVRDLETAVEGYKKLIQHAVNS